MIKVPCIKGQSPRVMLISQDYFIVPELIRSLKNLGISFVTVDFQQSPSFLKDMFRKIAGFRPHFILSINHAGLDADGQVLALLKRCGVPFASWFVDRQELFLKKAVDPDSLLAVFSWDPEAIHFLNKRNVPYSQFLPLGTDTSIFYPDKSARGPIYPVSFVGSSWTAKITDVLRAGRFPAILLCEYKNLARLLEVDPAICMHGLLDNAGSKVFKAWEQMTFEKREMYFRLINLQATRLRRVKIVSELLEFEPVIVGDAYWARILSKSELDFTWWNHLSYEKQLPAFYRQSILNFNATSLQSIFSLNQRVSDVPACRSFLLTEYSSALEDLFEPGKEVSCYNETDDVSAVVSEWLSDENGRKNIARAGMKRVFAHHTYQHRIIEIISKMRLFFYH
ncbi:CgeB family protein [Maridesulfovibrio zosterae]|uniref:CgeB family protein n=1 Tax=Maridesulfovibrio zosterae TaxID=82171 RepID=UPI0003FE552E|nr:glycosyltransferase [Maridesulfovibrio zosterae]